MLFARCRSRSVVLGLWLGGLVASATAQLPTALLRTGGPVPGLPGHTVASLASVDAVGASGFAILCAAIGPNGSISVVWGSLDGSPGQPLFVESSQESLSVASVRADGSLAFAADLAAGPNDGSLWVDDQLLFFEFSRSTVPGVVWGDFEPRWSPGGSLTFGSHLPFAPETSLFVGTEGTLVYAPGAAVPGFPGIVDQIGEWSMLGDGDFLAVVGTDSGSFGVIRNGQALAFAGAPILSGTAVPAAGGGLQDEFWSQPADVLLLGDGSTVALGTSTVTEIQGQPPTTYALVVRGGQLVDRTKMLTDPFFASEMPADLEWNERGDFAYSASYFGFDPRDRIYLNGSPLVTTGSALDLNGDGVADATLTSVHDVAIDDAGHALFVASTLNLSAVFRVRFLTDAAPYCSAKLSSSGCLASIGLTPAALPVSGAADATLTSTGVEGLRNGLFFFGLAGAAEVPFLGGTLCVAPPLVRGPAQNSGGTLGQCDGALTLVLNDGVSPWDPGPGGTIWAQAWYRDPPLMDGFDVALSNAILVPFD